MEQFEFHKNVDTIALIDYLVAFGHNCGERESDKVEFNCFSFSPNYWRQYEQEIANQTSKALDIVLRPFIFRCGVVAGNQITSLNSSLPVISFLA